MLRGDDGLGSHTPLHPSVPFLLPFALTVPSAASPRPSPALLHPPSFPLPFSPPESQQQLASPAATASTASMFRSSRLRVHTCKIVLVTSLVWFVMDVAVIMYYSDCSTGSGWGCGRSDAQDRESRADHHRTNKGRGIRNHRADNHDVDLEASVLLRGQGGGAIFQCLHFSVPKMKNFLCMGVSDIPCNLY